MSSPTPPTAQQESILDEVFDTREYDKKVKQAQTVLFVVAAWYLLAGIIQILTDNSDEWFISLGIILVIATIFLGLGLWCKHKPLIALVIALILYIGLFILYGIIDPALMFKGIIYKVVAVVLLIKGIIAANEAQQIKNIAK